MHEGPVLVWETHTCLWGGKDEVGPLCTSMSRYQHENVQLGLRLRPSFVPISTRICVYTGPIVYLGTIY